MDILEQTIDKIIETTGNKNTNKTVLIFLFFSIVWHFDFWVGILLTSSELIYQKSGLMKNEWLLHNYFYDGQWEYFLIKTILALLSTYIFIWWLPFIFRKADKKLISYKYSLIEVELDEREKNANKRAKLIAEESKLEKAEAKVEKDSKKIWEEEYKKFKKTSYFSSFDRVIEAVYKHGGDTIWPLRTSGLYLNEEDKPKIELYKNELAYYHTSGLIKINNSREITNISFTEKGEYFVYLYSSDKNK